jgi:hypothetical protein
MQVVYEVTRGGLSRRHVDGLEQTRFEDRMICDASIPISFIITEEKTIRFMCRHEGVEATSRISIGRSVQNDFLIEKDGAAGA